MSLWSAAVVPAANGTSHYIASASGDTTIRFFTQLEDLVASPEELVTWDEEVSKRKLDKYVTDPVQFLTPPRSQVGDIKRSDLPGMEALGRQGKKDGEVIMIKNNDNVEAYQWVAAESTWQQVGQVVDAIGSGRKQLFEGKEYDHVFDVDVSEGMPPLKLPYNVTG
jgi:phospholipase A-2-activating protein